MHTAIEKSFQYRKVLLEQITYPLGKREEREGGGEGGEWGGGRECGGMERDVRKNYEINELYKRGGWG